MRKIVFTLVAIAMAWTSPHAASAAVAQREVAPSATFESGILRVERFGKPGTRALVFVPGLFCGSWEWNAQINALSKGYDVLVVTLPGMDGRSMIAGDDLMARAAQSLHGLIAMQRLNSPILIGHSLGGTLSVYFAERYPRDVTGIVTVEGGFPVAPTQNQRDAAVAQSIAPYQHISQSEVGGVIRATTLQYTIASKADVVAVEKLASRSDRAAIVAWLRAALTLDLTPGLSKIVAPFTVIIPFDPTIDPYTGYATAEKKRAAYVRWAAHAPRSKVILIEPARHFVMFDRPEEFERALESAISR